MQAPSPTRPAALPDGCSFESRLRQAPHSLPERDQRAGPQGQKVGAEEGETSEAASSRLQQDVTEGKRDVTKLAKVVEDCAFLL
jgi:hypothetical protein